MTTEHETAVGTSGHMPSVRARAERRAARRSQVTRRRRRAAIAAVLAGLIAPFGYSYVTTMLEPSSLPLGIRSVEWAREHGFRWLVNDAENVWYRWHAPAKGGPALTTLPQITTPGTPARRAARHVALPDTLRLAIRPRLPGEGVWHPVGIGGSPVYVTTFRSDPVYPQNVAYLAWIDHSRTQLALYPGRYEPPSAPVRGPMQVPYGERWRLIAAFNSGFTYKDGQGGFAIDGKSYEPLRRGLATLVAHRNGSVNVQTWNGGPTPPRNIVLARQNLPLIVVDGRPSSRLNDSRAWGATLGNAIRVWRSGVGIDKRGNLIYAAANYQTVSSLANILIRAGAVRAMQLDINAEWPSFNVFAASGGRNAVKIVPNGQQQATRYLSPDDRDFFAVYRRIPHLSLSVPLK
ncbi:MAG TPA: phosphodiester glycosidase family protein [Gaiellaceae bacterium]|nr:phosphodiester glycosidase family protein [Gaiellaceae bacterium]